LPIETTLGIGALIAFTGALSFILIAVLTVFFGRRLTEDDIKQRRSGIPPGVLSLPPQVYEGPAVEKAHAKGTPGTVVLVLIFLTCFALYYFTNWKMLSFLWKVG